MRQWRDPGIGARRDPDMPASSAADTGADSSARAGERFALLVRPQMAAMLQMAAALVGFADAEDAAQEAVLRGLRAWPTLREPAALRGWLLRITYNVCLDWRRGHFGTERRQTQPLEETTVAQLLIQREGPGTSEHAARMDLRAAINALPDDLRRVVVLRYYAGLDSSEIGTVMDLPAATVRSHLRRARAQLRERLGLPETPAAGPDQKGGR